MADRPTGVVAHEAADVLALAGRALGPSGWLEVTQERVDAFATAVDDWHWAHDDPEAAARGPFGGTIAHAHLTLGLVPHLFRSLVDVGEGAECMFYGYDRVRFPTAVPVGRRMRLHATVAAVDDLGGAHQLTVDLWVEVEGVERPGCVARAAFRHYRLGPAD